MHSCTVQCLQCLFSVFVNILSLGVNARSHPKHWLPSFFVRILRSSFLQFFMSCIKTFPKQKLLPCVSQKYCPSLRNKQHKEFLFVNLKSSLAEQWEHYCSRNFCRFSKNTRRPARLQLQVESEKKTFQKVHQWNFWFTVVALFVWGFRLIYIRLKHMIVCLLIHNFTNQFFQLLWVG